MYDAYGRPTVFTDGNDADTIVNFNTNDTITVRGSSTFGNPYLFTGRRLDAEVVGQYYYRARYHDYEQGRFISRDQLFNVSPYAYVRGNPMNYVDPSGFVEADPDGGDGDSAEGGNKEGGSTPSKKGNKEERGVSTKKQIEKNMKDLESDDQETRDKAQNELESRLKSGTPDEVYDIMKQAEDIDKRANAKDPKDPIDLDLEERCERLLKHAEDMKVYERMWRNLLLQKIREEVEKEVDKNEEMLTKEQLQKRIHDRYNKGVKEKYEKVLPGGKEEEFEEGFKEKAKKVLESEEGRKKLDKGHELELRHAPVPKRDKANPVPQLPPKNDDDDGDGRPDLLDPVDRSI